jgi:hypothetical protein
MLIDKKEGLLILLDKLREFLYRTPRKFKAANLTILIEKPLANTTF